MTGTFRVAALMPLPFLQMGSMLSLRPSVGGMTVCAFELNGNCVDNHTSTLDLAD